MIKTVFFCALFININWSCVSAEDFRQSEGSKLANGKHAARNSNGINPIGCRAFHFLKHLILYRELVMSKQPIVCGVFVNNRRIICIFFYH